MYAAVVKVGGSLARLKKDMLRLCASLSRLAQRYQMLIVPGGGAFADKVREAYRRFRLSDDVAHWMALTAMNQFGFMLAEMVGVEAAERPSEDGKSIVLLPFRIMLEDDPLPHSWDATSDSVAAYIAWKFGIAKVVILTDVDGVFSSDPKRNPDARLLREVKASKLAGFKKATSVDPLFPRLIGRYRLKAWVLNGKHPDRLEQVLLGGKPVGTRILI